MGHTVTESFAFQGGTGPRSQVAAVKLDLTRPSGKNRTQVHCREPGRPPVLRDRAVQGRSLGPGSPLQTQCCSRTSLWSQDTLSDHDRQERLKDKVYYSQVLKGAQQTWGHTVRSQLGWQGEGVLLLLELRVGPRVSQVHS